MTAVAWATLEPGQTERIVGILLCRRNPGAQRIQPARGDGGLDVIVPTQDGKFDNYQVKYFHSRLTSGQKQQCQKSLKRAIGTHARHDHPTLSSWFLTLPLEPTLADQTWLATISRNAGAPFPCEWRGLSFLDGLAAEFPDVIEYYLGDGQNRTREAIRELRAIQGLFSDAGGAMVTPREVEDKLATVSAALNSADPHFEYEFTVGSREPVLAPRPGIVSSTVTLRDGVYVTWSVFARYASATDDAPINGAFRLDPSTMSEATATAWQDHLKYGTAADLAETVAQVEVGLPGGLDFQGEANRVKVGPVLDTSLPGGRARWTVLAGENDAVLAHAVVIAGNATRGSLGGRRVEAQDSSGLIRFVITTEPGAATGTLKATFEAKRMPGMPVAQVAAAARFMTEFREPHRLAIHPEHDPVPQPQQTLTMDDETEPLPQWFAEYFEALASIANAAKTPLRASSSAPSEDEETRWIRFMGDLVAGESSRVKMAGPTILCTPDDLPTLTHDYGERAVLIPMVLRYGGQTLELAKGVVRLEDCRAQPVEPQPERDDGMVLCTLSTAEGTDPSGILSWPAEELDVETAVLA